MYGARLHRPGLLQEARHRRGITCIQAEVVPPNLQMTDQGMARTMDTRVRMTQRLGRELRRAG